MRRAQAVRPGVAAADDDDVFALGRDAAGSVALALLVRRHQMFHGEVHPVEVAAFDVVVAGPQRPDCQYDGVVLGPQLLDGDIDADLAIGDEAGAFGAHLGEPLVEHRLLQLVLRDAVPHQSPDAVVAFVHRHVVPGAGQLLGRGQPRRSRPDDGHPLAGGDGCRLRLDDAVHPGLVGDRLFDPLDRHAAAGVFLRDRQHTRRLARGRAEPAGELREVVGGVQAVAGGVPPAAPDQIVPFRDQVAQWTTRCSGVAERNSAVHASAGLLGDLPGAFMRILTLVDLAPVTDPFVDGTLGRVHPVHFEESMRISHGWPP